MSELNEEKVQVATAWVQPLAKALMVLHDEYIATKLRKPSSHDNNWASELGHPCDLYLTYRRVQGDKARSVDIGLQRIFEEGNKQEDLILRELEAMGVRILERGVSIQTNDPFYRDLRISGKIDAKCNFEAISHRLIQVAPEIDWARKRVVAECKSLSPHHFDKLVDYDALMVSKYAYIRRWAEQMQLYLLGNNDEAGLFVFKSKVSGEMRFIPVVLDLETCEVLAQRARRVNDAVEVYRKDDILPDPIPWRQDLCANCPFLAICPNSREIPASEISTDEELIQLLEQREALKESKDNYEDAQEAIDERLDKYKGQHLIVGNFQVRWNLIRRAEKLQLASEYYQKRITKLPEPVK